MFCEYKDILGQPGTGLHSYRVFDFAIFDIIGTILIGYMISRLFDIKPLYAIMFTFLVGCFLHWIFCVDTTFMVYLYRCLGHS